MMALSFSSGQIHMSILNVILSAAQMTAWAKVEVFALLPWLRNPFKRPTRKLWPGGAAWNIEKRTISCCQNTSTNKPLSSEGHNGCPPSSVPLPDWCRRCRGGRRMAARRRCSITRPAATRHSFVPMDNFKPETLRPALGQQAAQHFCVLNMMPRQKTVRKATSDPRSRAFVGGAQGLASTHPRPAPRVDPQSCRPLAIYTLMPFTQGNITTLTKPHRQTLAHVSQGQNCFCQA